MTTRREFLKGAAALAASPVMPAWAKPIDGTTHRWWRNRPMSPEEADYQRWMWESVRAMKPGDRVVIVQTRHHVDDLYRCIKRT